MPNETLWRPIHRALALLHAQRTNLPEKSRLELWSKPGQRRKETLSMGGPVRKRRLMSPQEQFNA
jgi:hypothetical protein